ncbi:MAG: long-chain-fatty-acid--CoA ligase [Alphaproteobacteria bacterium]
MIRQADSTFEVKVMTKLLGGLRNGLLVLFGFFRPGSAQEEPERHPVPPPRPWERSYPAGLSWDAEIPIKPLFAILDEAVTKWSDRPCLEFLGKRYTYAEVGALVARAAKGFQELGVGKGVHVGLFLPNSAYYVICYHAVIKAGGTVVNFNPLYAEREIARQIKDSGTKIMVTMNLNTLYPKVSRCLDDGGLEKMVVCGMGQALSFTKMALFLLFKRREVSAIPTDAAHVHFSKLIANDGIPAVVDIDPHRDIAVLQYTGGTTGLPKGAMLTHANLYANTVQTGLWAIGLEPGCEKVLAVLPLFHVFGMTAVMNLGLYCGSELLLLPRFKLSEALGVIAREKPTVLMGVPTIYSAINDSKERENFDLSSLKYCVSGGAPLPPTIKSKFEELTGCDLVEGYGLSEAGPVCTINPISGLNKAGSAGLPLPGTLIEVVSLDNPTDVLPIGETGEIVVSGPQIMAGYWNQEQETLGVLSGGRLRTGDVGRIDEDGYIYIVDRIKDLIISGGFNVYPRMVEEAILMHPAVEEVAVCGVPDKHRGEVVKAFVKTREIGGLTGVQLRQFLKDKLAPFEIPRRVEFRESIPKTLVGKPLRRELVAQEQWRDGQKRTLGQPSEAAGSTHEDRVA